MRLAKYFLLALPAVIAAGCKQPKTSSEADTPKRTVFFDKSGMDTSVKPGDNFFLYANGGWIKNNRIPDEQSSWGIGNLVIEAPQIGIADRCRIAAVAQEPVAAIVVGGG